MASLALSPIELATLLPGARLLVGYQNIEETWRAEVYAESGPTIAYVKMLEQQQVVSEVVCAIVGSALGLNIPKPLLVYVEAENLPDSRKWKPNERERVCFGSEEKNCLSFRQILNMQGSNSRVWAELSNWSGFPRTAWFDEWVANTDRNSGNLLFDGVDFWLIDHAHALTGPNWSPSDLIPDKIVSNRFLSADYVAAMAPAKKDQFKNVAGGESLRYQAIALDTLRECGIDECTDTNQIQSIVAFLGKRAEIFMRLACDRLGLPRPLI